MKKAYELSVLCDCEISGEYVCVVNDILLRFNDKPFEPFYVLNFASVNTLFLTWLLLAEFCLHFCSTTIPSLFYPLKYAKISI